jgi:hypothetical protein
MRPLPERFVRDSLFAFLLLSVLLSDKKGP